MQKGEILENIEVTGIAAEGKAVARRDGHVIFVEGAVPGDIVHAELRRIKPNYLEARTVSIQQVSPLRKEPFCSHFGICGGCKWQHLDYTHQLKFKQQRVVDSLERIGGLSLPGVSPILPSERERFYRNRLDFTFSSRRWLTPKEMEETAIEPGLGFHIPRHFDKVLDIKECYLQEDPSNAIRLCVRETALAHGIPFFDLRGNVGYLRTLVIRTTTTGEVMVILQVSGERPDSLEILFSTLEKRFPEINALLYIINNKLNDTFHDLEVRSWKGNPWITEVMKGPDGKMLKFRIGPKSFFQTNSHQAAQLYRVVWDLAALKGTEVVYDLYSGTGTIADFVASAAAKVIGVENVEEAVEDARVNASLNNIENVEFYAGDMKELLNAGFFAAHGKPDVIITDPPRAGMSNEICQTLLRSGASRIVYVSCNPATQARDLKILCESYRLLAVQPVDMFPHTDHVENVVLLEKI